MLFARVRFIPGPWWQEAISVNGCENGTSRFCRWLCRRPQWRECLTVSHQLLIVVAPLALESQCKKHVTPLPLKELQRMRKRWRGPVCFCRFASGKAFGLLNFTPEPRYQGYPMFAWKMAVKTVYVCYYCGIFC